MPCSNVPAVNVNIDFPGPEWYRDGLNLLSCALSLTILPWLAGPLEFFSVIDIIRSQKWDPKETKRLSAAIAESGKLI